MSRYLKRGGIRLQWLLSYLALLLLPLLFGIGIYAFSMDALQKEAEEVQYQSMKQVGAALDSTLDTVTKMGNSILNSSEVGALAYENLEGAYDIRQRELLSELKGTIINTLSVNDMISDLYIYFPQVDYMLDASGLFFMENDISIQNRFGLGWEDLCDTLKGNIYRSVHLINDAREQRILYTTCIDARAELEEQEAVLIARLDNLKVQNLLKVEGIQTILWQEDGSYLTYGEDTDRTEEVLSRLGSHEEYTYKKDDSYMMQFPLQHYDLSILHIVPQSQYLGRLQQARYLLVGYVLLCLVAGVALMQYFLKRNYSPVKELLALTQKVGGNAGSGPEFVQIRSTVERLLEQYSRSQQEIAQRESTERSIRFYRLLNGRNIYSSISGEDWTQIQQKVPGDRYLLYSINLERVEGEWVSSDSEMIPEETRKLLYFIVGNVAEELLQERWHYYGAAVLDSYVFLLDGTCWKGPGELHRISRQIDQFLRQHYEVTMSFSISEIHEGREGIRECWREILQMNRYRREENFETILFYQNWKEARKQEKILEEAAVEAPVAVAGEKAAESGMVQQPSVTEREGTELSLADQVAAYIEENYADKALSGGMLADIFGLSQSNLTQKFKRKKDVSIVEYIDYIRLENAKTLLAAGCTVKDTADRVGYYNTRPLIRIFRDIEGITPTEYRAMFAAKGN